MISYLIYIVDKVWPPFVALVVAQWLAQRFIEMRKPKLQMVPEEMKVGIWKHFNANREEPYHMWRINVQHIKIPWYLSWLIKNRESALQCKADLTFYTSKDQIKIQGRWVNTAQISHISPFNQQEKIIYPDTISVAYHSPPEPLDCIVKFDNEKVAYGWNNEAYATNGKNPRTRLEIGTYKVTVRLSGQNFQDFTAEFKIVVAQDWQETSVTLTKD